MLYRGVPPTGNWSDRDVCFVWNTIRFLQS
jgi:hypothetical protein